MQLNLSDFIEIDKKIEERFPTSFLDGSHLSILFSMTHNKSVRGETYREFKSSNEMGLLSFLLENKNVDINVDNIKKMYSILSNTENADFRIENANILTGKKFYVPTSKDNVNKEMKLLCEKYSHLNHPNPKDFDDVFKFALEFICIHPFTNGNGRLSAFLVELLLTKFGLKYALYLPFDALINGIYISHTTSEIRKASGFYYKMKEYEFDSCINYMKELLMQSYELLLETINKFPQK